MNLQEITGHPLFSWFVLFVIVGLIQLIFYWFVFSRVAFFKNTYVPAENFPPVSVVICARNEYSNLKANLPLVLQQDYPEFEVVVVNHLSEDDSYYLLRDFQKEYPHLKIVTLHKDSNFFQGKKYPLSIGIKESKHEILVLTDADCRPDSSKWLRSIISAYKPGTEIVLGFSKLKPEKGLLQLLQRFETFHTGLLYLSLARAGMPYMGVGRNLSYKRNLFFKHQGFINHYMIASGDDDLFVNKAARRTNTAVNLNPESFTTTKAKSSWAAWFRQKRRHYSTGIHYRFGHKIVLGLYSLTQIMFYLLLVWLLVLRFPWWAVISLAGLRIISQWIVWGLGLKKLNAGRFVLISPLLELLLLIVTGWIMATKPLVKESKWK